MGHDFHHIPHTGVGGGGLCGLPTKFTERKEKQTRRDQVILLAALMTDLSLGNQTAHFIARHDNSYLAFSAACRSCAVTFSSSPARGSFPWYYEQLNRKYDRFRQWTFYWVSWAEFKVPKNEMHVCNLRISTPSTVALCYKSMCILRPRKRMSSERG